MHIDYNKLRIGDRLVRTKGGFLSKHHVLYVGFWNNYDWIVENQYGVGVRLIALNQFLDEGTLTRVEYNNYSQASQNTIITRVNERLGLPYALFNYNCEHFVNEVLTGVAKSKQVQAGFAFAVGLGLCYAFRGSK